jgi:hypothetical protein
MLWPNVCCWPDLGPTGICGRYILDVVAARVAIQEDVLVLSLLKVLHPRHLPRRLPRVCRPSIAFFTLALATPEYAASQKRLSTHVGRVPRVPRHPARAPGAMREPDACERCAHASPIMRPKRSPVTDILLCMKLPSMLQRSTHRGAARTHPHHHHPHDRSPRVRTVTHRPHFVCPHAAIVHTSSIERNTVRVWPQSPWRSVAKQCTQQLRCLHSAAYAVHSAPRALGKRRPLALPARPRALPPPPLCGRATGGRRASRPSTPEAPLQPLPRAGR